MTANDLLSREKAAGYDPNRLSAMRVVMVGAGALGQNVGQNLALSQVGELCIVDFDHFEPHNATRSPCFPSPSEQERWGTDKAATVARKLREQVSWSESPRMSFLNGLVQKFGDTLFANATLVISAVDSNAARAYIASMCKKHKIPLVEGGFDAADVSFSVAANHNPDGPCWLCNQTIEILDQVKLSCTARAKQAEKAGFIPATQPAAAALAALMAEAVIQVGHGNQEILDRRVYLNVRSGRATMVRLVRDENCQGRHFWPEAALELSVNSPSLARDLLDQLSPRLRNPSVFLPHRFIATAPCGAECGHSVEIGRPDWALSGSLVCQECGGSWRRRNGDGNGSLLLEVYTSFDKDTTPLLDLPLEAIGIPPGSVLEAQDENGAVIGFRVSGSISPISVEARHED